MVEEQLRRRGITDARVLDAMSTVPRERFVPADLVGRAYDDAALPIESGQTISQPYMVAAMLEAARIGDEDCVLEVGTGSGYAAALLGRLASTVHSIERDPVLYEAARERLGGKVCVHLGDGSQGWPEAAPFDVIMVAAAAKAVPGALRRQLALGGRLIMPIGDRKAQRLIKLTHEDDGTYAEDDLGPVMFVPLVHHSGARKWLRRP